MNLINKSIEEKEHTLSNKWHWFFQILIRPVKIFRDIADHGNRSWLMVLACLSLTVIILSVVSGPPRLRMVQMNQGELPKDFQYLTEAQQNQYFSSQQAVQKPLFIYILPLISSLASLWIGWFIFGSVIHLLMTFKGSRQPQEAFLNLVAWAAIPFILRGIIQIINIIVTKNLISQPGLSGFIPETDNRLLAYIRVLLSMVDLFGIWFLILIFLGSAPVSGLTPSKARWAVIWASLIFIILASLPGFFLDQLSNIGTIQPFIMF